MNMLTYRKIGYDIVFSIKFCFIHGFRHCIGKNNGFSLENTFFRNCSHPKVIADKTMKATDNWKTGDAIVFSIKFGVS